MGQLFSYCFVLTSLQWRFPIKYILQHISLLLHMFFLLSWMLHAKYYEWNITYSTRKLKCTNLIQWNKSTLPLLSEYSSTALLLLSSHFICTIRMTKTKILDISNMHILWTILRPSTMKRLYSNLHALRYLFITFYSSWKVNISEYLISTMHTTKKVNHFKNST